MLARLRRFVLAPLAAGALAGGVLLGGAPSASADYGSGAQYQVEISDNCHGLTNCDVAAGFGVWLWIELNADGTGDYQGTDCAHQASTPTDAVSGAAHESGDVAWSAADGWITIEGVRLLGGAVPVTVTVPAALGHYTEPTAQFFPTFVPAGTAQVQVAP